MNVCADFSEMHCGGDALIAVFVCRQGNLYKLITLLQRVPNLFLTVMKSADRNAGLLTPGTYAQFDTKYNFLHHFSIFALENEYVPIAVSSRL